MTHLALIVPARVVPERVQVAEDQVGQPAVFGAVERVVPAGAVGAVFAADEAVVQAVRSAVRTEPERGCVRESESARSRENAYSGLVLTVLP